MKENDNRPFQIMSKFNYKLKNNVPSVLTPGSIPLVCLNRNKHTRASEET